MAREIDGVAEALFEKIRARFEGVSVGDSHGKATTDPTQARFFNFDFTDATGNNFGNVTISIIDEQSLKVYFGKNLSADLDEVQKTEWYNFLRDLRMFAMRSLLKFDTRDISRSQLDIKDIQQQVKTEKPVSIDDSQVTEGYILKKLNVEKSIDLGNSEDYKPNITTKDVTYNIINNKTGKTIGTASFSSNDFFGGNNTMVVTLDNGKSRVVKVGGKGGNDPQAAFNRWIKRKNQPAMKDVDSVTESKLYGTSKTSYEAIAPGTRLIIRHSSPVDEAIHGSRSRKIHAVYIEDAEGQRFKSPFTNLLGSRALARHISNGGQIGDDFSQHISEMCEEMGKIRNFIKGSRNKTFENEEANEMVGAAKDRYQTLHQMLGKLKNPKGYKFYKESWKPSSTLQDDIDLEELKGKFVLKDFDDRLEAALPHVYRAYHAHKGEEMQNKPAVETHIDEFEESLDRIAEGTWAVPDNDLAVKKLQELMADVLPAGIDGADAEGALYDILGDDELFDDIYDASKGSPEMDVRPIVYDWLQNNMPSVFEKVKGDMESGHEEQPDRAPAEEPESNGEESANDTEIKENVYYSVESDSPPFYVHTSQLLETAEEYLKKARKSGQKDAKIYEVRIENGKKMRSLVGSAKAEPRVSVIESTELTDIRKLAGLN